MTLLPDERYKRYTDEQSEGEENDVDGDRVIVENFVGRGVEGGLGKVEEARETDDEAVDFAKGCEAEDFSRVVTVKIIYISDYVVRGNRETARKVD